MVLFDWTVLLAFLRLSTMARLFDNPLSQQEATDQVRAWLDQPGAEIAHPAPDHVERIQALLAEARTGGTLVDDAHLAALSREVRGVVVSFDSDFDRFSHVRRVQPRATS